MVFLCTWTHPLIRLNSTLRKPIHLSIIHFVRFPFTGIAFGDPGNNGRGDMTTQLEYKFPFPPVYDSYIDGNGPSALVNIFWEEIFGFDAIWTCQSFCRISLLTCVSTCKSKSIHFHVSNVGDLNFLCNESHVYFDFIVHSHRTAPFPDPRTARVFISRRDHALAMLFWIVRPISYCFAQYILHFILIA